MVVYVNRNIEEKIEKYLNKKEIIAVVGPRQTGKTTTINHILDKIRNKHINRLTFDNVKVKELFENDVDSFIELHVKGHDILFIDEIQYAKNSGRILKYIYDSQNVKILISGSSAIDISLQSTQFLVGRIFVFQLFPFSFDEFLNAKNEAIARLYRKKVFGAAVIKELNSHLKEFIIWGGFPRVVLAKDIEEKKTVLDNIYSTQIMKDVKSQLPVSDGYKLTKLIKALSLQIGDLINYQELSNVSELLYSDVKRYLNVLDKTYICKEISPYYLNKRTELVKSSKIYFFDTGLRNAVIDNFSYERSDFGKLNENFVFNELLKQNKIGRYWRTKSGAEVDFIIESNDNVVPIEIKSTVKSNTCSKSFLSFIEKYKPKKAIILNNDFEGKKTLKQTRIEFIPFVKYGF